MHPAALPIEELLRSCQTRRQRRSGPGGQHRNKVETGIFIEHTPSGIRAEATEQRSQPRNQEQAIQRLRINLALQHRSTIKSQDTQTPSALWQSRLRDGKIQVNSEHQDFPAILAEALDTLALHQWEPKAAVTVLQCSASQLTKLLKKEPRALALVNEQRVNLGSFPLR